MSAKPQKHQAKSNKRMALHKCRDCDEDFLAAKKTKRNNTAFCPLCGENIYTERIANITIERPFLYNRQWTEEEDEIILSGPEIGLTDRQIAEELEGRTNYAIRSRRSRLRAMLKEERGA